MACDVSPVAMFFFGRRPLSTLLIQFWLSITLININMMVIWCDQITLVPKKKRSKIKMIVLVNGDQWMWTLAVGNTQWSRTTVQLCVTLVVEAVAVNDKRCCQKVSWQCQWLLVSSWSRGVRGWDGKRKREFGARPLFTLVPSLLTLTGWAFVSLVQLAVFGCLVWYGEEGQSMVQYDMC